MSSVKTAKLGAKYETVYYYKQKVVNWDFVASNTYDTFVYTPVTEATYTSSVEASLAGFTLVDINVSRYITEDSYARYSTYYKISVSNAMPLQPLVLIMKYYNSDPVYDITTEVNVEIDSALPTAEFETEMIGDNNSYAYTSSDTVFVDLFTMFPKGIYTRFKDVPTEGMNCVMYTSTADVTDVYTSGVESALLLAKTIATLPILIEQVQTATIETSYTSGIETSGSILPVNTHIASNVESVYTVSGTTVYTSGIETSHIAHSIITP